MPTAASPASPPAPTPTQTGYTTIGLLSFDRRLSGVRARQWADNLRFFWSAPAMSQVYRELERLAAAGLVVQRSVVREGPGHQGVPAQRRRRCGPGWPPPGLPVLRHPVALRVFFGHLLDPASCGRPSSRTGRGVTTCWPSSGRCAVSWATTRGRNAALVAEWGLDYFRGERAAVDAHRAPVSPLLEGPEARSARVIARTSVRTLGPWASTTPTSPGARSSALSTASPAAIPTVGGRPAAPVPGATTAPPTGTRGERE